ncbi:GNAT family N-acetyltransferase [Streptomyces sp. NBC_00536]|uniref:GNAT family N-acetyltransferase n=1 Tax=Streptomyces sp. NBC_00536 TaxID=2975769 RepID=UPI002E8005A3|nr:GNAT family N-acetyltransferase [Streptomyces sp. NBC_00536]WUC81757.1 GNAT family N-acetyltransferase [Streptomyces sp. NBC_00536]
MTTASDPSYPAHWEADVVLRDGGTARIRPITTEDADRLVSFYEQVSDESKYYRFFAPYPRLSDKDVHRFTHHDYVDRVGLAATVGGEFIATVRYDRIGADGRPASGSADEAEVAFLVQDAHQGRGVASALLEHIGAVARERGIRRFAAEVLPANVKMIKVFKEVGYEQKRTFEDGSVHLTLDLEPTAESLAVQRAREQRAEARSVQRLLAPRSVAVIGASRTGTGVGAAALRNLRDSGFDGALYAVNHAVTSDTLLGVRAYRTLGAIGEPVDLAVVAVPAERVPPVVADCGEHGVQGLVVLSAGYGESGPTGLERQRELVRQARTYGMRIVGPNAFGVINTAPGVRLNASLAPAPTPEPGRIGLFTQSGAIGIALLAGLLRRGESLSSFVSAGNRADVSGNDILQYWYDDPATDVALLYLETLGNPRKFTRIARRTAAVKPVVVVKGGRHSGVTPAGHAVPGTRLPDATVSELLRQAGVIRVDTVTELIDVGLLLGSQPLPGGPRVAILGNSESLGVLTYDACLTEGLRPWPQLDLTTEATPEDFRAALVTALAADANDAVIVTAIPAVGRQDLTEGLAVAIREAVAEVPGKPVAVVHVELGALAEALSAATTRPPTPGTGPFTSTPGPADPSASSAGEADLSASGPAVAGPFASSAGGAGFPGPGAAEPSASSAGGAGFPGPGAAEPSASNAGGAGFPGPGPADPSASSAGGAGLSASGPAVAGPFASNAGGAGFPAPGGAEPSASSAGEAGFLGEGGVGPGGAPAGAADPGAHPARPAFEGPPEAGSAGTAPHPATAHPGPPPQASVHPGPPPEAGSAGPHSAGAHPGSPPQAGPAGARPGAAAGAAGQGRGRVPAYPAAERAVRALAEAVRYAHWRRDTAHPGRVPEFDDIDETGAAAQLTGLLAGSDGALTLPDETARELLARYGIRVRPTLPAPTPDAAAEAARTLGYPVVLKTTAPHLRHRADLGGVRLDLTTEAELRRSYDELTESLGSAAELLPVVQAMAPRGVDTVVRAVVDPGAGAVLSFGLAGVASELLGDTAHRLVPATDRDAAELIRSIRTAPLLFGWRGSDPVDTPALEELLLRLSRLVDDHPEVVAVSLEPVVVATEGLSVLSATLRIARPPARTDLGPRTLPSY